MQIHRKGLVYGLAVHSVIGFGVQFLSFRFVFKVSFLFGYYSYAIFASLRCIGTPCRNAYCYYIPLDWIVLVGRQVVSLVGLGWVGYQLGQLVTSCHWVGQLVRCIVFFLLGNWVKKLTNHLKSKEKPCQFLFFFDFPIEN